MAEMYDDYGVVFYPIQKNGTNLFKRLFDYVLGNRTNEETKNIEYVHHIIIVRNPYDRLISQWMHDTQIKNELFYSKLNQKKLFKEWVVSTYKNGYTGNDNHLLTQTDVIQYIPNEKYKIFKLGEFVIEDLFYFLDNIDFENLHNEYDKILEYLNNETEHHSSKFRMSNDFKDYYDTELLEICNSSFRIDFQNFGYEMITPKLI